VCNAARPEIRLREHTVGGSAGSTAAQGASTISKNLAAIGTGQYWAQLGLNAGAKGLLGEAQGGNFADGFISSALGGLAASGAGIIGDVTQGPCFSNTVSKIIAHAALQIKGARLGPKRPISIANP
jgi:hypothetical protein